MSAASVQPRLPLVDLNAQHARLSTELDAAIKRVFASGDFILGAETAAFEAAFAAFCGARFAVACGNGTDALELALWGLGVEPGDEVITVAHTFAATAEAILRCGAVPSFVDVCPDTLLMDMNGLSGAITSKTKAIVPVHLYGSCVETEALMELAHRHGLFVVEDAAQAHGARSRGRRAGSIGDAGCFSFYPAKNLGACGDAGAILTSDESLANRLRRARDHGRSGKYLHESAGRNSRMDAMQAAILRTKLPYLESWNERRRQIATRYRESLRAVPGVSVVGWPGGGGAVHHLFVVQVDERDELRRSLDVLGIATGIHYPVPLHQQPAFEGTALLPDGGLPVTERAAARVLSLPIFPEMSDEAVDRVVAALHSTVLPPITH